MVESEKPASGSTSTAGAEVAPIPRFALVIGAMKSGTTTLYGTLVQHPEVWKSRIKETHFFSNKSKLKDAEEYYRQWEDFDPTVHKWASEASTSYTKYGLRWGMAERISEFPAEFRLIYILRDPIERIESHIAHNVTKNRLGSLSDDGRVRISRHHIAISSYAMQLDRYRSVMPDVPILLLDMADLKTSEGTRSIMQRCTEFLEIDPSFPFKEIKPRNVRKRGGRADQAVLTEAQREELRETLREDVRRLRTHYGFDTSGWPGFD